MTDALMIFLPFSLLCHIVSLCAAFRIDSSATCDVFCHSVEFFIHHVTYNVLFYLAVVSIYGVIGNVVVKLLSVFNF